MNRATLLSKQTHCSRAVVLGSELVNSLNGLNAETPFAVCPPPPGPRNSSLYDTWIRIFQQTIYRVCVFYKTKRMFY